MIGHVGGEREKRNFINEINRYHKDKIQREVKKIAKDLAWLMPRSGLESKSVLF